MKFKFFVGKVFVFAAAISFLCGLMLFSASNEANKPVVKKGAEVITIKGVTRSWKDVNKIPLDQREGPRKMKPVLNFENPRKIVKKGVGADPVVQADYGAGGPGIPSPTMNFAGMSFSANGSGWPPDTNGDVGLTYYVQTVNTSIGIYRKSDGSLVSATTFDDFFEGSAVSGTPCDENNIGDPIVLYDRYAQRWFILDFAWWPDYSGGSYYSIAVSKTADPTGDWWLYALNASSTDLNDYPKCGIWHDGIYITANMFSFSTWAFQNVKVWALKKPDIYNGTLTAQSIIDGSYQAWSLLPANAKSSTAPSSTAPNYMYALDADEYGSPHIDAIYVWKYDVDWSNPAGTTWTGPWTMLTAAFGLTGYYVPQQGTSTTLDSLYGRLMYSAMYRKFDSYESVYLCHLAEYSSKRVMRWYEIRISGGTSSIYQQGTYAPDTNHRWMGSIGGDKYGNIAMGYSVSSTGMYPSIRYAGRLSTDPLGQLSQGEASVVEGTGYQDYTSRWGDYSMMTIDPADDETFWYTNEYYISSGTNWQTRIGSFKVTGGAPPPDFNDAVDNASLTFTMGGNADWCVDTITYYYDNDSVKSGIITHDEESYFQTAVNYPSPRTLRFYWKVSSEYYFDYLRFYIDGVLQNEICGTVDWTQMTYTVSPGAHTLKWSYEKDYSVDSGSDCGWVDKIEFTGNLWADFNSDGKTDLLLRYYSTGGWNQAWYMDGVTKTGSAAVTPVSDPDWKIEGTGDFNNDGKTDILLRYYGAGGGWNQVWYMDGVTKTGTASLPRVADLNWKFEGTGDFNNDGKTDILLRYYGAGGGWNQVWYMDGVTRTGTASLPRVADLDWKFEGTGDFNNDGKTDILLRYYGAGGGWNQVWYMDGVTKTGSAGLPRIADLNWKFQGTGDFNSDGKTDIILRYYGAGGGWNQVWYMDGVTKTGSGSLPRISDLSWEIVN